MWGIRDSWANGLQHAKPPVCSVLMLFIFSPSGRQSRLPEAEMIWRPKKPHHILTEVSPGITPPSFLNGGLCPGAAFKKHMFVVACQWAMGVVKEFFFFFFTESAVLFVSLNPDSHRTTLRIFVDHTRSLNRLQRPYVHFGSIIPHDDEYRYYVGARGDVVCWVYIWWDVALQYMFTINFHQQPGFKGKIWGVD